VRKVLWLLIVFGWTLHAFPSATGLLEEAEALLPERLDVPVLQECIELYEEALAFEPENTELMVMLAQLWHEWAILSVEEDLQSRGFREAADYAAWAMGLGSYLEFESMSVRDLEAFLGTVDNPGALLWAADSWGKLLELEDDHWRAARIRAPDKFYALYSRLIEVDEAYFGAAGHRSMGALIAQTSEASFFAGWIFSWARMESARDHFESALELGGDYAFNHVEYARQYALPSGERDLFVRLLEEALDISADRFPLWNVLAQERARALLEDIDALF